MKRIVTLLLSSSIVLLNYANIEIYDVSRVNKGIVKTLVVPESIEELSALVVGAQEPIAIAGGRFSQGGHVWYNQGNVIDMTSLNNIVSFDAANKTITVQAGITWAEIQKFLVGRTLSIKVMQSYNDFTVGGSLSVNVHGRDISCGPLIETVESLKIMLADGSLVLASRSENYDLFRATIGGYGACGIIVEATLLLTDNYPIERRVTKLVLPEYKEYFLENIIGNKEIVFHNANIYPNDFQDVLSVSWYKTNKNLTVFEGLMPKRMFYITELLSEQILRRIQWTKQWRLPFELKYVYSNDPVVWRNHEMSATVAALEPWFRFPTTTVLQEYFIPLDNLETFMDGVKQLVQQHGINMLNISIRYVPKNTESVLSYAQQDCFSFVMYINFLNTVGGYAYAQTWTRALIDHALSLQGTYYVPYQLFGTQEQFEKAYPCYDEFRKIKNKYDPTNKFLNSFTKKYF